MLDPEQEALSGQRWCCRGSLRIGLRSLGTRWFVLLVSAALFACAGVDDDATTIACVESLPENCTASIPVNYASIYDKALRSYCGSIGSGTNCHGPSGNKGGLSLYDPSGSYAELLGMNDGRARVLPGDAKCSVLMERLETSNPQYRMPLGGELPAGLRCAIQQWIEAGAPEN
jgi:Planctomycete cytochrome C